MTAENPQNALRVQFDDGGLAKPHDCAELASIDLERVRYAGGVIEESRVTLVRTVVWCEYDRDRGPERLIRCSKETDGT